MTSELQEPAAYGGQMAKYFRLGKAPSLVIRPPSKPQIAITRLASLNGLLDRRASIPHEKAYVVSVHLTPACDQGCEIWVDGRYSRITTWPAGGVAIYDLEADPHARNRGPIDWVHYHVPRSTLDAFTDDVQLASIESLRCQHGTFDQVLHHDTDDVAVSNRSTGVLGALSRSLPSSVLRSYNATVCSFARCNEDMSRWTRTLAEASSG